MSAPSPFRVAIYPLIAVAASALAGCGRYVITADDIITTVDGQKTVIAAAVLRDYGSSFHEKIAGAKVRFVANGRVIAQTVTNDIGRATAYVRIDPKVNTLQVLAQANGQKLKTTAAVYRWSRHKTIVSVDLDETISATRYSNLFITELDQSKPIAGACAVVWALTKDYEILYISARPQFLQEKTRQWLQANSFPPAPYIGADRFAACLNQGGYKRRMLAGLKARWPNLLIGVGDKPVDDKAYGANNMVTFIVNSFPLGFFSQRSVMFKNWPELQAFFSCHRQRLANPALLAGIIRKNGDQLRPVFANAPTDSAIQQTAGGTATPVYTRVVVETN